MRKPTISQDEVTFKTLAEYHAWLEKDKQTRYLPLVENLKKARAAKRQKALDKLDKEFQTALALKYKRLGLKLEVKGISVK